MGFAHQNCCEGCRARIEDHRVDLALLRADVEKEQGYGKDLFAKLQTLCGKVVKLEGKRLKSEGRDELLADPDKYARIRQVGKAGALVGAGVAIPQLPELVKWFQHLLGG